MDLSQKQNLKICMAGFSLVVVASVKPPSSSQARLDRLKGDLQHHLKYMSEHKGCNIPRELIKIVRRKCLKAPEILMEICQKSVCLIKALDLSTERCLLPFN